MTGPSLTWSAPDAYGIISAPGIKRLAFRHDGRELEVRALVIEARSEWIITVKEGARFVAPTSCVVVSNQIIFDARMQGGPMADALELAIEGERAAVIAGDIPLLDFDQASELAPWAT